ncbi:MAG: MlaC/ttg2D family ABC transporter substrate-binding protein [Alphaproteobacteria bacterium]
MSRSRAILFPLPNIAAAATALVAGVAITLALLRAAGAAPATDPADFVRDFGNRVIATATDDSLSPGQRQEALEHLLSAGIDARRIGRFVLGKYGRRATDAERAEFDRLFAAGIVTTYSRHLGNYAGEVLEVRGAQLRGERGAIVSSRVVRTDGPAVAVEWRLRHDDAGTWRVVDVVIEGLSMALSQRAEYTAVIRASQGRVEGLLVRLREQAPVHNDEIAGLTAQSE